jgi:VWFA-related protein
MEAAIVSLTSFFAGRILTPTGLQTDHTVSSFAGGARCRRTFFSALGPNKVSGLRSKPRGLRKHAGWLCVLSAALLAALPASLPAPQESEVTSRESELTGAASEPTFRLEAQRNLVLVRVVVRDQRGRVVPNLTQQDFKVLEEGKEQAITHFSVETPAAPAPFEEQDAFAELEAEFGAAPAETAVGRRFLGLFFDDVHMPFEDIVRTREAAERYLDSTLSPGDRVGIFTASGQNQLDFTDDRGKIHEAVGRLLTRAVGAFREDPCPEVLPYQAYLMIHRNDPHAIEVAEEEAVECDRAFNEEMSRLTAENRARSEAVRTLNRFQTQAEYALRGLDGVIRRMAALPGQRSLVMVSPGFLMLTIEHRINQIIDRALRSNVIVNTLDSKGLYAFSPLGDPSKRSSFPSQRPDLTGKKAMYAIEQVNRSADALRFIAYDTGGEYVSNTNDYDEAFRKAGGLPEMYYLLAYSPQKVKFDGRFRALKVKLARSGSYTIQARSGYYTPKKAEDPAEQAQQEITQALFSRDEVNELPVQVHTQFFKTGEFDARLSILTRVDIRFLSFRKDSGRNLNHVVMITALFDRNGNYVAGKEKTLEFRLFDASLEKLSRSGLTSRMSFDVKPGVYLVRQIVREAEGARISALNRTVEIPY